MREEKRRRENRKIDPVREKKTERDRERENEWEW